MNTLKSYISDRCIWAFNVNGLLEIQAISQAANNINESIVILVSPNAIKFTGLDYICEMLLVAKKNSLVPLYTELDHGRDESLIIECARRGFDVIMVDGSTLPYKENIKFVKCMTKIARTISKNILIETEVGVIGNPSNQKIITETFTDPDIVEDYIRETQSDLLAVSIGNQHGFSQNKPPLNRSLLVRINRNTNTPLVLHGGDWIPEDDLIFAIKNGVRKINIGPEIRIIAGETIKQQTNSSEFDITDYRSLMTQISNAIQKHIEYKLNSVK